MAKKAKKKAVAKAKKAKKKVAKKRARRPPYKCREVMGGCLKFYPDSNGDYVLPAGGEPVNCEDYRYWF